MTRQHYYWHTRPQQTGERKAKTRQRGREDDDDKRHGNTRQVSQSPLRSPTAASVERANESGALAMSRSPWECWAMWSLHTEQMLGMAFAATEASGLSLKPFIR